MYSLVEEVVLDGVEGTLREEVEAAEGILLRSSSVVNDIGVHVHNIARMYGHPLIDDLRLSSAS